MKTQTIFGFNFGAKKTVFVLPILFLPITLAFSIPGVQAHIPDLSGEYVYYKDSTFERDTYFGILFYDEGTYGARYFAPEKISDSDYFPKKDIQILFTLNPEKDYVELTGERIITRVTAEDTDLVNYIHDIVYELSARRKKAGLITESASVEQTYEQFGGFVTINFDAIIPIFNVKNISKADGSVVFSIITAGKLSSSNDTSFRDFSGLPNKITDNVHVFSPDLNLKKQTFSFTKSVETADSSEIKTATQTLTLDENWTQSMENLWSLNQSAILAVDIIQNPESNSDVFFNQLKRKMTLGIDNSYSMDFEIKACGNLSEKNDFIISTTFYNALSKSFTKDFKILTKLTDDSVAFFTLTVFYGPYSKNKNYFNSIIESYSVK